MRKILLFLALALAVVTLTQLFMTGERTDQRQQVEEAAPMIGGDFTLTDQNGAVVHESDFRGRLMLVFFGYTHCPDVCPITVANLSQAMTLLGDKADQVAPLFITVDPERDTSAILKDYLANFDTHLIGLTGTPEQIKAVASAYKAYFARNRIPWNDEKPEEHHEHDGEYVVDHSAFIYLMGRDGHYIRLFPYDTNAQDIAHVVEKVLK